MKVIVTMLNEKSPVGWVGGILARITWDKYLSSTNQPYYNFSAHFPFLSNVAESRLKKPLLIY
jgi:hypothetical protein